uniref:Uncharacterized protein n=1 Tax=Arion vulgaris TaxID=1028688 RepID=A0A0B7AJX0_9EUPU
MLDTLPIYFSDQGHHGFLQCSNSQVCGCHSVIPSQSENMLKTFIDEDLNLICV